jgi:cytochrome P450
LRLTWD